MMWPSYLALGKMRHGFLFLGGGGAEDGGGEEWEPGQT